MATDLQDEAAAKASWARHQFMMPTTPRHAMVRSLARGLAIGALAVAAVAQIGWITNGSDMSGADDEWRTFLTAFDLAVDASTAMLGLGYAFAAAAIATKRWMLLRVAGTFGALYLIAHPASMHLVERALLPIDAPETTLLVSALILIAGQAALLAAPWLAGRAWRWTGLILLVAAASRLAGFMLFWVEDAPPAASLAWVLSYIVALSIAGVACLARMPPTALAATTVAGIATIGAGIGSLPSLEGEPVIVSALVLELVATLVLLAAWMIPRIARLAMPAEAASA